MSNSETGPQNTSRRELTHLERQIREGFRKRFNTTEKEREIAEALKKEGEYVGFLDEGEFTDVVEMIAWALIYKHGEEVRGLWQNIPGIAMQARKPISHEIVGTRVGLSPDEAKVSFSAQIKRPIKALIGLNYSLVNSDGNEDSLILKDNRLDVEEETGLLDWRAKAALMPVDIGERIRGELSNLGETIREILPLQLEQHGYYQPLGVVGLKLCENNDQGALRVFIASQEWVESNYDL